MYEVKANELYINKDNITCLFKKGDQYFANVGPNFNVELTKDQFDALK